MNAQVRRDPPIAEAEEDARTPVALGILALVAFFIGLGGWASIAPLDSAAIAPAVVKVEGNRKSVQHLEGGIVKELRVKEGDRVAAGDVLIVLDNTQAKGTVDVLAKQYAELTAQEARLRAERDGASSIRFPQHIAGLETAPEMRSVLEGQVNLFNSRRATLQGQTDVLRKKITQAQEQIVGFEGQLASYKRQLESTRSENAGLKGLFRQGYVPRQRMLELERAEASLEGQISDMSSNIVRARQLIEEYKVQIIQTQSDRLAQVANDLRDVQVKLLEIGPQLSVARAKLERTEIRSPYSGIIVGLSVFSVGGVISPGEKVMDIVPGNESVIVEATVAPEDVKDIHAGMRAEVHLTAYKQRTIPIVHGTLLNVSADRLTDNKTGAGYYLTQVKVDEKELAELKYVKLAPGMPALVMIPTGERTALDYLLRPLTESVLKSFREK
ncbi:MAG TPA: HlyD family type I secretion periplasmic adaptor subunit [Burkholderiales bacterium]|nr:HlyD family type I secretion periplasmic adaptor subunit [Burkholderiales bacterium]